MAASATPPLQQAPAGFKPSYDIMASFNSSRPVSQTSTPAPRPAQQPTATMTPPPPATDPFAALVSASPRTSSPFPSGASSSQSPAAASSSLLDLAGAGPPNTAAASGSSAKAQEDDEWNFASSLPESTALPTSNKVQVLNSSLRIEFVARRHPSQPRQIHVVALFSNTTGQPLNELHFQVAVEKVSFVTYDLKNKVEVVMLKQYSLIHCSSGRSLDVISHPCSRMGSSRRCYWTESMQARVIRSKFGLECRTG